MAGHGRIRKAASRATIQARTSGTAGETARAKAKIGMEMASPRNGKIRTDIVTGARQHGKARTARKAAARAVYTVLTKPVTATGGSSQTDHSPAHNLKKQFSAC